MYTEKKKKEYTFLSWQHGNSLGHHILEHKKSLNKFKDTKITSNNCSNQTRNQL